MKVQGPAVAGLRPSAVRTGAAKLTDEFRLDVSIYVN
jgi:hypothetical protein